MKTCTSGELGDDWCLGSPPPFNGIRRAIVERRMAARAIGGCGTPQIALDQRQPHLPDWLSKGRQVKPIRCGWANPLRILLEVVVERALGPHANRGNLGPSQHIDHLAILVERRCPLALRDELITKAG